MKLTVLRSHQLSIKGFMLPEIRGVNITALETRESSKRFLSFFFFELGYSKLANNVVIVSGEQQRVSAIHIHIYILLQTPLPSRLPNNIEQSSLCLYSRSLLVIHFRYSSMYTATPNSLTLPSPCPHPSPSNHKLVSLWVSFWKTSKIRYIQTKSVYIFLTVISFCLEVSRMFLCTSFTWYVLTRERFA